MPPAVRLQVPRLTAELIGATRPAFRRRAAKRAAEFFARPAGRICDGYATAECNRSESGKYDEAEFRCGHAGLPWQGSHRIREVEA